MGTIRAITPVRLILCVFLCLAELPAFAADTPPSAQADTTGQPPKAVNPPVFVYKPPHRGAPTRRLGGGTRGISQLNVLVPNHTAISTQEHPHLYWYISPGFRNDIRFRLNTVGTPRPLLEIVLPPQPNGGIHYLDLAVHRVSLEPGTLYEWGVMLEPQPHQRWPALVSLGRIVVDPSDSALASASPETYPYLAAQRGYWYDALHGISRLVEEHPGSPRWREQRAVLLELGGLLDAAMYDRGMARPGR